MKNSAWDVKTLTLIGALSLLAGAAGATGLAGHAGYWNPKDGDESYGYGAKLLLGSAAGAGLELRGTYFEDITSDTGGDRVKLQAIPIDLGMYVETGQGAFRGSLSGGISYLMVDTDAADIDDELAWYLGLGLSMDLHTRFAVFVEGLYRGAEATLPDDRFEDIEREVTFDLGGFAANLGLLFRF